jgi:Tol biopolymer transport system component
VRKADGKGQARRFGEGRWPDWSPDGKQIAFVRDGELWSVDLSTGRVERLVEARLPVLEEPRWSPDGRYLAFRARPGGGDILAIGVDGANERVIGHGTSPVLSPDGQRIAFVNGKGGLGLAGFLGTMKADGSEAVALGDVLYSDSVPNCLGVDLVWSPDSSHVAYWSCDAGSLYVAPAVGREPPRPFGEGQGPSWSPDSARLVYAASGRSRWCSLYIVPAGGGAPELLADRAVRPAWSPDGRWIAYEPYQQAEVRITLVSPTDPSTQRFLAEGTSVKWAPDSKRVAYYRSDTSRTGRPLPLGWSSRGSIIVQAIDQASTATNEISIDGYPTAYAWSPDGRRIAFSVSNEGQIAIYIADLADPTNPRFLTHGTSPSWSPDGKTIVFSRYYTN